ncbi:MAG: Fic family protein [Candidatus Diapherotrites archaeon]|nr:Fic family protein [Candidatus Diapherotrites archaeon]
MALRIKTIAGKPYYYLHLSYFIQSKSKSFSKYVGTEKPTQNNLTKLEGSFRDEIIEKLGKQLFANENISKDDVIKTFLFRDAFNEKYKKLSPVERKNFEVNRTILFTLTTLTTEDVDVDLNDVMAAYQKEAKLDARETISKNMLEGVAKIKESWKLDEKSILSLHKTIMASFETKNPGTFRQRQVYIHRQDEKNPFGIEIAHRPPSFLEIPERVEEMVKWYNSSGLNPIEKAAGIHFELYVIHPFLDGNKRVSRLLFNKALIENSFPLVNISEKKEDYFRALIQSVEAKNVKPFTEFALNEFYRQVRQFLKAKKIPKTNIEQKGE